MKLFQKFFSKENISAKLLFLAVIVFACLTLLLTVWGLFFPLGQQKTSKQEVLKSPAVQAAKAEPSKQPVPAQSYNPSYDRIWTSMVPGETYVRDSLSKTGTEEFLQRYDNVQITVPAPAAGIVSFIKNNKNHTALTLSDEKGKLYYYRFSKAAVKIGQKVTKGETLGFRPGVISFPVISITAPDGKRIDPRPYFQSANDVTEFPAVKKLPPDADKP